MASRPGDTLFALFHFALVLGALGYGLVLTLTGAPKRGAVILAGLAIYYALVLHPPVVREIRRRRALKKN
jgi:hypothetical protein